MKMVSRHRNLSMLIALALIWGASFMFIKVAVRELSPATLIVGRLGLAAITLGLLVPFVVGASETLRPLAWWRGGRASPPACGARARVGGPGPPSPPPLFVSAASGGGSREPPPPG